MLCVGAAAKGRFYCAAIVTASIAIGATSPARAATYYWNGAESEPGLSRPERPAPQRRQQARHTQDKEARAAEKEAAKPQGPLILAVSINKQQVKVYDSNGLFTTAPVSTGMKGHATPMGVFSVIQKQKFHRSNIYSGAPMPFMQRITWSGIAMHAGVLPGYPASHGCIRMPAGFAVKMYGWTRMGARVLVTPGETAPASFAHPLLLAFKAPQPTAATQPDTIAPAATTKTDKGADASKPMTIGSNFELRSTIGHDDGSKSGSDVLSTPLRNQTHTADASNVTGVVTISDATPGSAAPRSEAAPEDAKTQAVSAPKADGSEAAAKIESKTESKPDETAADVPTKPGAPIPAEVAGKSADKPAEGAAAKPDDSAGPAVKAAETPADNAAKADAATPSEKTSDAKPADGKTVADKPADTAKTVDVKPGDTKPVDVKDPPRLTDADKPAAVKPELKRTSQIAIFISRKDSKLYVRQSFAPVFNTPITIAPSDRPLGTHVFTAAADKTDASAMHWSVISLPASRNLARSDDGERGSRRSKKGAEAEVKVAPVPDSPAEALDRVTIPPDVMAWLGDALSNGSSLIISDQGINQGETGEGTEFIVSLR
jgi:lipoprotein-anchoring transpeptidase ErfK/SrfK